MTNRPPSDLPEMGEKETRDWHPDEQPEENEDNLAFTDEQAQGLQQYINDIRDRLGLSHWDIFLTTTSASPTTNASVHPVYGRRVAALAVNKGWWDYSAENQRNTIVHEILHVVHNQQTEVIRTTKQLDSVWVTFERETELMVDHLANALSPLFPLPEPTLFQQVMNDLDQVGNNGK